MRARMLLWVACFAAASCSTVSEPLSDLDAARPLVDLARNGVAAGTLVIARDRGFVGHALAIAVEVDGLAIGTLEPGQLFQLRASEGLRLVVIRTSLSQGPGTRGSATADPIVAPNLSPGASAFGAATRPPASISVNVGAGTRSIVRIGFSDRGELALWQDTR